MATPQDVWNEIDRRIGQAVERALVSLGFENVPGSGQGGGSAGWLPIHNNAHHEPKLALESALTAHEATIASDAVLGHVKIDGGGLTIDGDGLLSVDGSSLSIALLDLTDVSAPSGYAGQANKSLIVKDDETGVEFVLLAASDVGADPAGTAAAAMIAHLAAPDPHPQYLTETEADLLYAALVHTHSASDIVSGALDKARGGTGISNTGALTVPNDTTLSGGAANQIGLWTALNTLGGDAGLTYNPTTDVFALAGTATITATSADTYPLYIVSDQPDAGTDGSAIGAAVYSATNAGRIFLARALGTLLVPLPVSSGTRLFTIDARGWDGGTPTGAFATAAQIQIEADGTVTSAPSAVPGRTKFLTADSVGTLIEAARFTSAQAFWLNITSGGLATAGALDADGEVRSNRTTGGLFTLYRRDTGVTSGESIGILAWENNDSDLTGQRYAEIEVQASRAINSNAATGKMLLRTTGVGAGTVPVERMALGGYRDNLTDAANNSLLEVTLNAGEMAGGTIIWTIIASDGTDHQSYSGVVTYSAVNKAGAYTTQITHNVGNDSKAVSAGTLTAAWNILAGVNKVTVRVNPASSLTETTYRILYTVLSNSPQSITLL